MDSTEYRRRGKEMVDYIADYLQNIRQRDVFPDVSPGYMRDLVPDTPPTNGECWDSIFEDVERVIMPGVTHWQSPHMHAYFPALNSYPSMLGDMLSDGINCLGFTWASSPACTELETIVMDWLGKMIGLPSCFLHSNEQTLGGGVIQTTASEATFVALLAARSEAIRRYRQWAEDDNNENIDEIDDAIINAKLVAYCSDQAHSSVEKATLIGLVKLHLLPSDDDQLSLRGDVLQAAIEEDKENGLIPFFLCATSGTTGACAFDNLEELGPICEKENIWMHVDAAYAGSAFVCPEYRVHMAGVDKANSFAFNPSKWLMVNFDCTAMWVKNSGALHKTFNVEPLYLKHENTGAAIDYMHWQIPLSRRFRSLKLWFVIRSFGIHGLQEHIRKGINHAQNFENLVRKDSRFEVVAKRYLGMVVFRLKGDNDLTEELLRRLNSSGKVHMVPASLKGKYVIRFTVTSTHTTDDDIRRDWYIIKKTAGSVLNEDSESIAVEIIDEEFERLFRRRDSEHMHHHDAARRRKEYGMSLLLSNVPMSPKVINGSFAAIFDSDEDIPLSLNGRDVYEKSGCSLKSQNKQHSVDTAFLGHSGSDHPPVKKQTSVDSRPTITAREWYGSLNGIIGNGLHDGKTDLNKNGHAVIKCSHCGHDVDL